jgi:hypothetical protein
MKKNLPMGIAILLVVIVFIAVSLSSKLPSCDEFLPLETVATTCGFAEGATITNRAVATPKNEAACTIEEGEISHLRLFVEKKSVGTYDEHLSLFQNIIKEQQEFVLDENIDLGSRGMLMIDDKGRSQLIVELKDKSVFSFASSNTTCDADALLNLGEHITKTLED